ncbi:hypothetical protein BGZ49_007533 [Haplosporangium sp. Z 27]|nr:hypothetical protein BGZ49_007533 [Haplosporangium sp. Z 27]
MPFLTATLADQPEPNQPFGAIPPESSQTDSTTIFPNDKNKKNAISNKDDRVSHGTIASTFASLRPSFSRSLKSGSSQEPKMTKLDRESTQNYDQLQLNNDPTYSIAANPSAFYASHKENNANQNQKPSILPSSSLTLHGPLSHHLDLKIENNDSFSADLEAFLFDTKTAPSGIESTQSKTPSLSSNLNKSEPCHTANSKLATPTLSSPSINRGTTVDFTAQLYDSHSRTANVTPTSTSAISNSLNSEGPISILDKTAIPLQVSNMTVATNSKSTSLSSFSSKGQSFPSSSSSSLSLSSSPSVPLKSRLDTQHDLPILPQQILNNSNISNIPQTPITNSTTPTIHIMSYPSPPLQSATISAVDKNICESNVNTIEILTQSERTHIVTPTVSYTTIIDSDVEVDEDDKISSPSTTPSSDNAPSSPHITASPPFSSSPSSSSSHNGFQSQHNAVSDLKESVAALQITPPNDYQVPIPQKSEDWAALVDTPASPIYAQYPNVMPKPFLSTYGAEGYTDSPAPEDGVAQGYQGDYMQHMSQYQQYPNQQYYSQQQPQNQYPYPHFNLPYQYQHHNSTSSVPLTHHHGNRMGSGDFNNAFRKSWSASETLNGPGYNSHGYLTPPRHPDDLNRSRPGSSMGFRQPHTSVSLLTDTAVLAKYRETAIKTNDPSIQLSYAKYLLEIGEPPVPNTSTSGSRSSSSSDVGTPRPSFATTTSNTPPSSTPPSPTSAHHDTESGKKQLTQEAVYWIDRLAKEGVAEAQFIRATWYEEGLYSSKMNLDKALRWYQSASKGEYGPAHYKVAYFCEKKKDNNKAVMLYKKAAVHNEAPANYLGQSRNMKAGLEYLKRAAAFATEAAPKAPYVLGLILAREYGDQLTIPDDIAFPDDGEALEWFRKSAQLGYGPADYKLGYCYEFGSMGCAVDPFLSVHHYERAVLAGDSNGEAEMGLSGWYLSGAENCFQSDEQLAFQYASIAAEKKYAKAQYAMGYYYEVGVSVPTDMDKAMEFYKLAAANGNKDAIKRLENQSSEDVDKLGHKKSIKKIKQGRRSKDQSCNIM